MRKKGLEEECALPKLLLIAIMNKKRMPEGERGAGRRMVATKAWQQLRFAANWIA